MVGLRVMSMTWHSSVGVTEPQCTHIPPPPFIRGGCIATSVIILIQFAHVQQLPTHARPSERPTDRLAPSVTDVVIAMDVVPFFLQLTSVVARHAPAHCERRSGGHQDRGGPAHPD